MVSDELQSLYDERRKRQDILQSKPDSEWCKKELKEIEYKIKNLERVEKPTPKSEKVTSSDTN